MLSVNAIAAAAAMAAAPGNAADFRDWYGEYVQDAVAYADVHFVQRLHNGNSTASSDGSKTSLTTRVFTNNSVVTSSRFISEWVYAPALFDLQSFMSLGPDWDGENAPAPDAASIIAAADFLKRDPNGSRWEAVLNADGRVSLETEGKAGLFELMFGPGDQIVVWSETTKSAQQITVENAVNLA
ncbi:hypothetical protein [uncultured Brevundimonas sp.]|uniref:hypothetical protein n=1 Tax=uncultured Brevundimonas sp. TaxID=213418 RepID=UPI0025E9766D|nr:hypothetical protein [uncultured Brevundimonas sp.]